MPSFARFVLVVIIAAVIGSFALVVFVNHDTGIKIAEANAVGQEREHDLFDKLDKHFRRLDITAAAQQISGDHKVLQTTVAWREWGFTVASPDPVPLAVQTFVITGDEVTVGANSLAFQANFTLPAEFKEYSGLFAARTFMFFTTLSGEGAKDPIAVVTPAMSDPPPCLLVGTTPSALERRLWQSVWGLSRTATMAKSYGLVVGSYQPLHVPLRLGALEKVWIQDKDTLVVREEDDVGAVRELLDTLSEQRAKAAAAAAPTE